MGKYSTKRVRQGLAKEGLRGPWGSDARSETPAQEKAHPPVEETAPWS